MHSSLLEVLFSESAIPGPFWTFSVHGATLVFGQDPFMRRSTEHSLVGRVRWLFEGKVLSMQAES